MGPSHSVAYSSITTGVDGVDGGVMQISAVAALAEARPRSFDRYALLQDFLEVRETEEMHAKRALTVRPRVFLHSSRVLTGWSGPVRGPTTSMKPTTCGCARA